MRGLLESSWRRFGPAGRGSYDWLTPAPPSAREQQGFNWNDLDDDRKYELLLYALLPATALLLLLALLAAALWRRCRRSSASKMGLANVIATLDLQDAESGGGGTDLLLSSLSRHASTSSAGSDGVFVMVYLPPPYEETLSKITRAASLASSKDAESVKIEDLEAKLCPEIRSSGRYV
ncbi:small integral membrane protein 28 [Festucalex cinctus]